MIYRDKARLTNHSTAPYQGLEHAQSSGREDGIGKPQDKVNAHVLNFLTHSTCDASLYMRVDYGGDAKDSMAVQTLHCLFVQSLGSAKKFDVTRRNERTIDHAAKLGG